MPDDRVGFSTHFDQIGGSPYWASRIVMPLIQASGVQYVRDDWNWSLGEVTPGVYTMNASKLDWLQVAAEYGLKVVAILNPNLNKIYADPYDPTAAANYCAWLMGQVGSMIDTIEVTNEPNNYYAGVEGSNWEAMLVTLTDTIYHAVKAVSPNTRIISYGGQGAQVLSMLGMGSPYLDGVVYHPYDAGDNVPEHVYEPPFTSYVPWVQAVRAATGVPIWETERNGSGGGEFYFNVWNSRRFLLSYGLGIEHSFLYDFTDTSNQSVMDNNYGKRQAYYAMQAVMNAMNGVTTTGVGVTLTPGQSNFDLTDFYSYVYAGPSKTVAAVWLGNHAPNAPPLPGSGTVTFTVLNSLTSASVIVDIVKGITVPLTSYNISLVGTQLSVFAFPITDHPQMIIVQ
jgi:hypothetical protein